MSNLSQQIRLFAQGHKKSASAGDPETKSSGNGVVETAAKDPTKDTAVEDMKKAQPTGGNAIQAEAKTTTPDRMNAGDGEGGVTSSQASATKDPGENELKAQQPTDGIAKNASFAERIAHIRNVVSGSQNTQQKTAQQKTTPDGGGKSASGAFDIDMLVKMASAALETEEGVAFFSDFMEKSAGREVADQRILEARQLAAEVRQGQSNVQSAIEYGMEKAAAIYHELAQHVTEDDCDYIIKTAALHEELMLSLDDEQLKSAYAQGTADAAAMEMAEEDPDADLAMALGGEDPEGAAEGTEILQALEDAIAKGLVTEEEVTQALAELEAEGGEAAAMEGAAEPMPAI